ncbi:unnamed protein product, partial [Ilex paraguariensis]
AFLSFVVVKHAYELAWPLSPDPKLVVISNDPSEPEATVTNSEVPNYAIVSSIENAPAKPSVPPSLVRLLGVDLAVDDHVAKKRKVTKSASLVHVERPVPLFHTH